MVAEAGLLMPVVWTSPASGYRTGGGQRLRDGYCCFLARPLSADRQAHLRMKPGVMTRLFYAYRTGGNKKGGRPLSHPPPQKNARRI